MYVLCNVLDYLVVAITEKPNRVVPTAHPDAETVSKAHETLEKLSSTHVQDKRPSEAFKLPCTSNMEYGFFSHQVSTSDTRGQPCGSGDEET